MKKRRESLAFSTKKVENEGKYRYFYRLIFKKDDGIILENTEGSEINGA